VLYTEENLDDALVVALEEAWEDGREDEKFEIARNALAEKLPFDVIHKITGLSLTEIEKL